MEAISMKNPQVFQETTNLNKNWQTRDPMISTPYTVKITKISLNLIYVPSTECLNIKPKSAIPVNMSSTTSFQAAGLKNDLFHLIIYL